MKRIKHALYYIAYTLAYGFWYLMSLLPLRVLYVLSDLLCLLMARVMKYRHKVIWKNLTESFPEKSEQELKQIERGFYHYFCDYIVETIKLMTMSREQLMQRMTFTGLEELNKVLADGITATGNGSQPCPTGLPAKHFAVNSTTRLKTNISTACSNMCVSVRGHSASP